MDSEAARAIAADPSCFSLIAWNARYYGTTRPDDRDRPYIDLLLQKSAASERDKREAHSWRATAGRLAYTMADHLPVLVSLIRDPAIRSAITETLRYFENRGNVGRDVRQLLKDTLRPMLAHGDPVLLIAHSMGSVIAYDALWELWYEDGERGSVDLFLTLGSPLGMHYVQKRLVGFRDGRRYPGNVRRWINVAAEGDLTALDARLADDFRQMVDRGWTKSITDLHDGIFTCFRNEKGLNVHRSYGYLVHPAVGGAIATWWNQAESQVGDAAVAQT